MAKKRTNVAGREQRKRVSARDRAEKRKAGSDRTVFRIPEGMSMWKPTAGKHIIDLVEFPITESTSYADAGMYTYEQTFFVHFGIGASNQTFLCPKETSGKPCPICERRSQEWGKASPDEDLTKALRPKERQLFLVYDHGDKEKGLQLFEISHHCFGKRLEYEILNGDEDEGLAYFASIDTSEGKTLRVAFESQSIETAKYLECTSIQFKDRSVDIPESVLEQVVPLDTLLVRTSYENLKSIFLQETTSVTEEKTKEKPARKTKSAPPKTEPKDEEDDEEAPWDSNDEVDENDEEWEDDFE